MGLVFGLLDHHLQNALRIKHYVRSMDDFVVFGRGAAPTWALADIERMPSRAGSGTGSRSWRRCLRRARSLQDS
jgi:hypothetical protein